MKRAEEGQAWLVLNQLPGIAGMRCRQLVERFGSARAALEAPVSAWEEEVGAAAARRARNCAPDWQWAAAQWKALQRRGGCLRTLADPDYPALLREIAAPPPVLFVLGEGPLDVPCVGIVGPRRATDYGQQVARQLARALTGEGFCIVSGMAAGVDSAAHRGALQGDGRTIAVLGCGVDVVYPAQNADLHRRLQTQGAVISEFPLGAAPEPGSFPRRNRIISGLSLGVVVVEAPEHSGSLITAAHAVEQNREVFAVPGNVLNGRSAGCHRLIKDGAKLVEGVEDVLMELEQWLSRGAKASHRATESAPELSGDAQRVFDLLGHQPRHVDQLAEQVDVPLADLLDLLLRLELDGLVAQLPGKQFVRAAG